MRLPSSGGKNGRGRALRHALVSPSEACGAAAEAPPNKPDFCLARPAGVGPPPPPAPEAGFAGSFSRCGDGIHSVECLEKNFMALQKKMEDDFSQVETIQMKVKALSADWEERHHQLKVEHEKVAELEAQIKLLNTKQEEVMASLQADMLHAASQIQEKEELAEQLRSEVSFLEKRVRVACEEAAGSAAELEKGAHEARLALEATLSSLCPQLDREEVARETFPSEQETLPPLQPCVQFLYGQDAKCPRKAEGAEAAAEEAPQGLPQEAAGGLQEEEAKPRASRAAWVLLCPPIFFWLPKRPAPGSLEPLVKATSSCVQKPTLLSELQRGLFESPFWERLLQPEKG
ncbi:uncharacterized protein LOC113423163 [Notechis scutatus]|uniref:Uncharacterized protein LOC113423163 n=1 Tax=Notechis scutatus TaxID=8663 RepID=A0A6J1VJS6_9SAUR|nr:uncharacterized protein LOC113423163 [Notechis scutatus]